MMVYVLLSDLDGFQKILAVFLASVYKRREFLIA